MIVLDQNSELASGTKIPVGGKSSPLKSKLKQ